MNLQVQLVPPHSRGILPRQSIDFEAGQTTSLCRTASTRSQESSTTCGSTSSFSSATSTANSSSSSARRIVPLYNLQAHNVLPNVIVDAGTDAKIAKFQKRGIELIDLALFEPVEVWPDPNAVVMPITTQALAVPVTAPGASTSTLGRLSVDEMGFAQVSTRVGSTPSRSIPTFLAATGSPKDGPFAPDDLAQNPEASSTASLSSTSHADHQISHSIDSTAPPDTAGIPPGSSRRNFFGKIFKKSPKDASPSRSPYLMSPPPTSVPSRPPLRPTPSVQPPVPRPQSGRLRTRQSPETSNESCDQVGTPTPMQLMTTPTLEQPHLNPKDSMPGAGGVKRNNGLRTSWLLGSSNSSQRPQSASSPLATAFSSLAMKRRSVIGSGPAPDNVVAVNLNLSQTDVDKPQGTPSANVPPTHVLTTVQSSQIQSQPQLCPAVLGIQPTLVVVPTSFVQPTHSKRRHQSKSPNSGPGESSGRGNGNGGSPKPKEKERQGKASRRPYMYAWLARKWMKHRPPHPSTPSSHGPKNFGLGGLHLSEIGTGLGIDASWMHTMRNHELSVEETVEVRLEWRRTPTVVGSKKKLDAGASGEAGESSAEGEEHGHHRRAGKRSRRSRDWNRRREGDERVMRKDGSFDQQDERVRRPSSSSVSSARAAVKRWSLASYQSQSTAGASEDASGDNGADSESDPEDSETPWVCTLKVRRTAAAIGQEAGTTSTKESRGRSDKQEDTISGEGKPKSHEWNTHQDVLRIKVGTLSPTPHHPKVVAMLKMPFPLPDVQVERLGVVKRRGLGESLISPCLRFLCAKSGHVPV